MGRKEQQLLTAANHYLAAARLGFIKKMPKEAVANKRPRRSPSSEFNPKRFVSSVTRRSGLRERGFDLDVENSKVEYF